jgi:hypothetical protein
MTLAQVAAEANLLGLGGFASRYGPVFLLVHGRPHPASGVPMQTRSVDALDGITGEFMVAAMPIRRRAESQNAFIGVGRLNGNDIPLSDETVSKFHAYFKEDGGRWVVQDARSRNGTAVDNTPVAARGEGPPTPLSVGQAVRFGSVATTFLDAEALVTLAQRFARLPTRRPIAQ